MERSRTTGGVPGEMRNGTKKGATKHNTGQLSVTLFRLHIVHSCGTTLESTRVGQLAPDACRAASADLVAVSLQGNSGLVDPIDVPHRGPYPLAHMMVTSVAGCRAISPHRRTACRHRAVPRGRGKGCVAQEKRSDRTARPMQQWCTRHRWRVCAQPRPLRAGGLSTGAHQANRPGVHTPGCADAAIAAARIGLSHASASDDQARCGSGKRGCCNGSESWCMAAGERAAARGN